MQRRALLRATAAAGLITAAPFVRAQASLQKFRFNLGWKTEASGAGFLLALQRGYYREAGLDVTIDTGNGSAAAISLVAGGAYDAASADLSTMIEFNLANPQAGLRAVAIQYDLNPNSVMVRRDGPIRKPADLAGRVLLGRAVEVTLREQRVADVGCCSASPSMPRASSFRCSPGPRASTRLR
jgi:NitT/TauT family transport system substrate-binding protein